MGPARQPESLLAVFARVRDPRQHGKVVDPLSALLGMVVLGAVCGGRSLRACWLWGMAALRPPDVSRRQKKRGRLDERMVWVVDAQELAPSLRETFGWGPIRQVGWIYRRRRQGDHDSQDWTTWLTTAPGGTSLAHAAVLGAAGPLGE